MNAVSAASSRCSYQLRFESLFHAGRALAFPCDDHGHVVMDGLSDRARHNYLYARAVVPPPDDVENVPPPVVTAAQVHGGGCAACALGAPAKTSRDLVAGLLASVGSAVWLARRRRRPMT